MKSDDAKTNYLQLAVDPPLNRWKKIQFLTYPWASMLKNVVAVYSSSARSSDSPTMLRQVRESYPDTPCLLCTNAGTGK